MQNGIKPEMQFYIIYCMYMYIMVNHKYTTDIL